MSTLKSYRKDLQKQWTEGKVNTKEYIRMRDEEITNIFLDPTFLYTYYWEIEDDTGRIVPFHLWLKQEEFIWGINDPRYRFWVNLKSRRMGFTEMLIREMLKDALLKNNQNEIVISQNQAKANIIIRKLKQQHQWLKGKADFLRSPVYAERIDQVHFGYSEKDALHTTVIKGQNSIVTAYPKGENAVVGETARGKVFWDEMTLQDNTHAVFAYLLPILEGTDASLIVSGTARGMGNKLYELFTNAFEGRSNGFKWFFMGYFDRPGRTQATWDAEVNKVGSKQLVMQEYPRTPEEAFQASGQCIFDVPTLKYMLKHAPSKPEFGQGILTAPRQELAEGIYGKCNEQYIKFVETGVGGAVKVFVPYNPEHEYLCGVDCALGKGRNNDYTFAWILDLVTGEQVATYRKKDMPEHCADDIEVLCKWYGSPLAIVERDSPGLAFLQRFRQIYSNIHGKTDVEGWIDTTDYTKLGTSTRHQNKETFISGLVKFVWDCVERDNDTGDIIGRSKWGWINDSTTLEEMLNFVRTETGRLEADKDAKMGDDDGSDEKMHDDSVTSGMQIIIGLSSSGRYYLSNKSHTKIQSFISRILDNELKIMHKQKYSYTNIQNT